MSKYFFCLPQRCKHWHFSLYYFPYLDHCTERVNCYFFLKTFMWIWKIKSIFDRNLMSHVIFTFGCVTGWVYNFIFPQSSPVAHNFPLFDLATVLKSVPSIVSGQIPMVLKLKRQVWVAHSTSRNVIGLVIWRHTVAFPKNGCENWRIFFETMYFVVINIL